jgi:uncharacterized membrane protein
MERKALESAGANYGYLRGLFFIPIGLLLILAALGNWEVGPLTHDWVFLAAALAIATVCLPINRYYNENYGRVRPSTRQQLRIAVVTVLAAIVVVGGSTLLRSHASWSLDLPVNATAVTFALVMLMSYAIGVGLKAHHVIIWGALLVAGAVPVWNGADPSNIGLVLNGVAVAICGIFDHRLFMRTFGSPKAAALQDGDVRA